jgi:hypothetical protein
MAARRAFHAGPLCRNVERHGPVFLASSGPGWFAVVTFRVNPNRVLITLFDASASLLSTQTHLGMSVAGFAPVGASDQDFDDAVLFSEIAVGVPVRATTWGNLKARFR